MAATETSSTPLTQEERKEFVAVALDTNSMGGGHLSLGELSKWVARCATNDLELWVPEAVLLEWAEHAAAAYDTASTAASKERTELRKVDIEASWPVGDRAAVVAHVVKAVRAIPGVVVLDIDPADAVEAVKDELLAQPPGGRKKTIKTGAGDSALLRAVHRNADQDLDRVVLVTGDVRAVEGICGRLGWARPFVVDGLHALAARLGLLEVATTDQALALARAITRDLPTTWASFPHTDTPGTIDVDAFDAMGLSDAVYSDIPPELADFLQETRLTSVDRLVGLDQVLIDETAQQYLAEAYFLCTATATTVGYDSDGATSFEEHEAPLLLLRCRIRATVADGELSEFDPGVETVDVFEREDGGRSPSLALEYAREALAALPGVGDDVFPPDEGGDLSRDVGGHHLFVRASSEEAGWKVSAEVDGQVVATLQCSIRNRLRWRPGFLSLETSGERFYGPVNPPWEFAAEVLEAVLRSPVQPAGNG